MAVQPMLQNKSSTSIIDLCIELNAFRQAISTLTVIRKSAMTILISSTTCERTFSKMKTTKTTVRNSMTDSRLSDICLLAAERDIDINFEQLTDTFSDIYKKQSYYAQINIFLFCFQILCSHT
ncbi:unnamed protein product [Rotaria sp. Silwood1]|nr:unnamed protein product [Rotaria sp. Silwood1]